MFEAIGERMGEVGARVANADAETLWAMIERMAAGLDEEPQSTRIRYALAGQILKISKAQHWTPLHTALVLAYAHMVLSDAHNQDLLDVVTVMQRTVIVNRHCEKCLCEDKQTKVDNG